MAITNKKEFMQAVRGYIVESLDEGESVGSVAQAFYFEYVNNNRNRVTEDGRELFGQWLRGLPSQIAIDFMDHDQAEMFKQWIEAAGGTFDASRFNNEMFYHVICREFWRMHDAMTDREKLQAIIDYHRSVRIPMYEGFKESAEKQKDARWVEHWGGKLASLQRIIEVLEARLLCLK